MLQHEQAPQTAPFNYAPPNYTPITPQELAQAVVAVEERQGSGTQTTIDPAVIQQTLEQGRVDVTPEQLLKEVQMHRIIAHQDAAMTRRKNPNLPLQLLAGASVAVSLAAALLLAYSFMLTHQLQASSEALAVLQDKQARATAYVDASQELQKWIYPGAVRKGNNSTAALMNESISGGHMKSLILATSDSYSAVCNRYFDQARGVDVTRSPLQHLPGSANQIVPIMGESGTIGMIAEGGQPTYYEVASSNGASGPIMTFSKLNSQATVNGLITYDAVSHKTIIKLIATTPIAVP